MMYRRIAVILAAIISASLFAGGFASFFGKLSFTSPAWSSMRGEPAIDAGTAQAEYVSILVNKRLPLTKEYVPDDLTVPDIPFIFDGNHEKRHLREAAAAAAEALFDAAKRDGIELLGVSGYRSYETQRRLWNYNVNKKGIEEASRYNAYPGMSEHQTGLALDVTSRSAHLDLTEAFGETKEGRWLAEHAHRYGFILRYPQGKEDITGYSYEPWHIRFIGEEAARELYVQGLTMEEWAAEAAVQ
jgi:zinc D-Ala-D-Ala carboxypeptidase